MAQDGRVAQRGFTLLELMAVVLIMGSVLLLVPMSLDSIGGESKLKNTANSLVAAVNGARDRAILDSYEVWLEIGSYQEDDSDEWRDGWRFKFTSLPPAEVAMEEDSQAQSQRRADRAREREWIYSSWHSAPSGLRIVGVSQAKGQWNKLSEGGKPFSVRFFADGTIESALAIRIENVDMEADREYRTLTIIVNGLTSEASWGAGFQDLHESLPSSKFQN